MQDLDKIFIASDHRGYNLKYEIVKNWSKIISFAPELKDVKIIDLTPRYNPEDDYPDSANELAKNIKKHPHSAGILLCGTGIGVSIAANRHKNIRAAIAYSEEISVLSRQHNDANVICIPADYTDLKSSAIMILKFFTTPSFTEEKYLRRSQKLDKEPK